MVAINRLNQVQTLDDDDLSVIWQNSSGRTRSITVANLRKFIQSTDPNSDAFVKAELIGDDLVLTSHDENETKIDINLLPSHSVTELNDMPDNLIAGQYLKVKEDGSGFILTPSSEISAEITVQAGDGPTSEADVLKFTGSSNLSVEDKVATIESGIMIDGHFITKIYTESDLDVLIEDDEATISVNNKVSPWPIEIVGIGDSPKVIDKVEQLGVEYQFSASSMFTQSVHLYHLGLPEGAQIKVTVVDVQQDSKPIDVFQLSSGGDLRWPVITPTVFTLRSGLWRVEESSQLLHVANSTTFDGDGAEKQIVHGLAADPSSLITMEVNDQGVLVVGASGAIENPVVKTIGIDSSGSGNPNFKSVIRQDDQLHTIIDATRELRINYKDVALGSTLTVMGIDNNQAQFLVPIMQGNDAVALKKDIPNADSFIQKHTNAELNRMFAAYQGKYGDNRIHHPVSIYQDVNGWTQLEFTGNMLFKPRGKDTGTLGEKVLEIRSEKLVAHKETEILADTTYAGDTSQPKNPITREALNEEPQKEWFIVANGVLSTNGSRPTGGTGAEGELAVWHNVTSESTTEPANELKVLFSGAYDKVYDFSKPLRFKLSQQSGSRNQYWTVPDNGWQTEGNVWHLSADKVTGDNLVVGVDTKIYASAYFLEEEEEAGYYQGQGLGVPEGAFLTTGTVNQSEPVGLYYNALNDGSSRGNIELNNDDGYNEFNVIIQGLNKATRDWRIGTGTPGRYSDKTIRTGETWMCRVYVDWGASSNTNFFWTRLDDGYAVFDAVDTSSFDSDAKVEVLKKSFENKDLVSIPVELPDGFDIIVSSVICKVNGRMRKQPFEYQYDSGILRVHLNEVCTGIIIAELIK